MAGWAGQQPCRATLSSLSASTPRGPRNVWLAQYAVNFCFQTQLHLPVETCTAPFLLSPDIAYGCSCVSPSFLSAVVGIKKPALSPVKNLLAMLTVQLGHLCHRCISPTSLQDSPQSLLGCVRLRWSTSNEATPQIHSVQSAPDCTVLRNQSCLSLLSVDTRFKGILSPLYYNSSNILRRNRNPFSVKSPRKVCNMIQSHVSMISCLTSEHCSKII